MASNFPSYTALAAAALGIFQMLLMLYAAGGRGQFQVGLGDGGNPQLLKRIRIHGNLAENAPIFLILLLLVEMSGQWTDYVPWVALAFVIGRILHAIGLAMTDGVSIPRFLGVVTTVVCVIGLAVLLIISYFGWNAPETISLL